MPQGWICRCQLPITTLSSEPEPDLAVVVGSISDFRERHPSGTDCRLIIEVSDSSWQKDRAKGAIYFSAGVKEYWIVSLADQNVECYQEGALDSPQIFSRNDTIGLKLGDSTIELRLSDLL